MLLEGGPRLLGWQRNSESWYLPSTPLIAEPGWLAARPTLGPGTKPCKGVDGLVGLGWSGMGTRAGVRLRVLPRGSRALLNPPAAPAPAPISGQGSSRRGQAPASPALPAVRDGRCVSRRGGRVMRLWARAGWRMRSERPGGRRARRGARERQRRDPEGWVEGGRASRDALVEEGEDAGHGGSRGCRVAEGTEGRGAGRWGGGHWQDLGGGGVRRACGRGGGWAVASRSDSDFSGIKPGGAGEGEVGEPV